MAPPSSPPRQPQKQGTGKALFPADQQNLSQAQHASAAAKLAAVADGVFDGEYEDMLV